MTTRIQRRTALGLITAAAAIPAATPASAMYERIYLDGMGHAIGGYDPVAYFTYEEALRGNLDHELETDEATWLFMREDHVDKFRSKPQAYIPQFGGYDAEGMARGFKRRSDPTLWVMIDSKVYLHYSIPDQNRWAEDIRGNIRLAEENWEELRDF